MGNQSQQLQRFMDCQLCQRLAVVCCHIGHAVVQNFATLQAALPKDGQQDFIWVICVLSAFVREQKGESDSIFIAIMR